MSDDRKIIVENTQRLFLTVNLFHKDVLVQDAVEQQAMLDISSMACSLSSHMLPLLEQAKVISPLSISPMLAILISCGGSRTSPVGVCEFQMKGLGCCISDPSLIVDGLSDDDDLILGSNVIKHFIWVLKHSGDF